MMKALKTLTQVSEAEGSSARWSTTLLVVFGPTLVMLLIDSFLVYILHYPTTSVAFAAAYVYASVAMQVTFVALVSLLLRREGSNLLRLINLDLAQLPRQLLIGVAVCGLRLVIAIVYTGILSASGARVSVIILQGFPYYFALFIGTLSAGFCIEVIWRGYGLTHLETLTKSTLWAVLISTLGSALWRLDLLAIGSNILGGLLFSVIYVKQRTLVSVIFAHWTKDIIGYLFQYLSFIKF